MGDEEEIEVKVGASLGQIFPHRYDPLSSILTAIFLILLILVWVTLRNRQAIKVRCSYYRLICWDMLSCPGEVEEHEQRPWQNCRVQSRGSSTDMLHTVWGRTEMLQSVLGRVGAAYSNTKGTSPPPPYDPPPPYTVAILMEGQEQLTLSPPITV